MKIAFGISVSLASVGVFYYFSIYLPRRDKIWMDAQYGILQLNNQKENCRQLSVDAFQKGWGGKNFTTDGSNQFIANYVNKFDAELGSCFYLEIVQNYEVGSKSVIYDFGLYDLTENRRYGEFVKSGDDLQSCNVLGQKCTSDKEWETLVGPYIGDVSSQLPR